MMIMEDSHFLIILIAEMRKRWLPEQKQSIESRQFLRSAHNSGSVAVISSQGRLDGVELLSPIRRSIIWCFFEFTTKAISWNVLFKCSEVKMVSLFSQKRPSGV